MMNNNVSEFIGGLKVVFLVLLCSGSCAGWNRTNFTADVIIFSKYNVNKIQLLLKYITINDYMHSQMSRCRVTRNCKIGCERPNNIFKKKLYKMVRKINSAIRNHLELAFSFL
jgi:hypothetical protein